MGGFYTQGQKRSFFFWFHVSLPHVGRSGRSRYEASGTKRGYAEYHKGGGSVIKKQNTTTITLSARMKLSPSSFPILKGKRRLHLEVNVSNNNDFRLLLLLLHIHSGKDSSSTSWSFHASLIHISCRIISIWGPKQHSNGHEIVESCPQEAMHLWLLSAVWCREAVQHEVQHDSVYTVLFSN